MKEKDKQKEGGRKPGYFLKKGLQVFFVCGILVLVAKLNEFLSKKEFQ